jgi:hypothetical protein
MPGNNSTDDTGTENQGNLWDPTDLCRSETVRLRISDSAHCMCQRMKRVFNAEKRVFSRSG